MRAVNLLPEKHRPRKPTGSSQGSAYVVLGALGAVLVGVLVYVLTLNSINSARDDIAKAKADTARYQAQAAQLSPYGDFSKVKQQRVAAVKQLAGGRVDWERMVRELDHVLPNGVWLTSAAAADSLGSAQNSQAGSGFTQGSSPGASAGVAANAPVLTLSGCAHNQSDVATTLVRVRELQGATDVKLDHSTQPDSNGSGSGGGGGSSSSDCGMSGGQPNYAFQLDVAFAPHTAAPDVPGAVPASLGGGQ